MQGPFAGLVEGGPHDHGGAIQFDPRGGEGVNHMGGVLGQIGVGPELPVAAQQFGPQGELLEGKAVDAAAIVVEGVGAPDGLTQKRQAVVENLAVTETVVALEARIIGQHHAQVGEEDGVIRLPERPHHAEAPQTAIRPLLVRHVQLRPPFAGRGEIGSYHPSGRQRLFLLIEGNIVVPVAGRQGFWGGRQRRRVDRIDGAIAESLAGRRRIGHRDRLAVFLPGRRRRAGDDPGGDRPGRWRRHGCTLTQEGLFPDGSGYPFGLNPDFDPAILGAAFFAAVVGDGQGVTQALYQDSRLGGNFQNTQEIVGHALRARLGQLEVILEGLSGASLQAPVVRMTGHVNVNDAQAVEGHGQPLEQSLIFSAQGIAAGIEPGPKDVLLFLEEGRHQGQVIHRGFPGQHAAGRQGEQRGHQQAQQTANSRPQASRFMGRFRGKNHKKHPKTPVAGVRFDQGTELPQASYRCHGA